MSDSTTTRPSAERRERTLVPYSPDPVTWASLIVVALGLGIYLRTLLPGVSFWDTGEAQTVPHTLGIMHPTGFPTYTMLGWLWSQIPIGDVAYRMNAFSAVCVAVAAGLTVHIGGLLMLVERSALLKAAAAGIGGGAFAFASEPWRNAVRADVHALHILFAALIVWLVLCWGAAHRRQSPQAGRWLAAAALAFGIGLGNHALVGLLAPPIVVWVFWTDRSIWRRWRLVGWCTVMLLAGLSVYLYIPIRSLIEPAPPLFYARPNTLERLRYVIFAEQFTGLFHNFTDPLGGIGPKWAKAQSVLVDQFQGPGWLVVELGLLVTARRWPAAAVFLSLVAAVNVFYSMNFQDGDIGRYYMTTVLVAAPVLAVAVGWFARLAASAAWYVGRRLSAPARGIAATTVAVVALAAFAAIPAYSVVHLYDERDNSDDHQAARWVESVYAVVPRDSVVVTWWSYSTPLWYHRWVLGERPDVKIIDDRNILDDGYGDVPGAIDAFLGDRPVYVVANDFTARLVRDRYVTESVGTYPGYTDLLLVVDRR
ncbi:MAG: DUF2723 domain-containing protein [Candidatus Limnocylindria bacterium]